MTTIEKKIQDIYYVFKITINVLVFFQLNETLSSKLACNDKLIIPPVDNLNNKTGIIVLKTAFHGY